MTDPRFLPPRAAYIHVPFCRHRCGYCNFTLVAGRDDLIEAYLEALARELSWLEHPRPVDTLFLGGGTPTHLAPDQFERLAGLARHWFPPAAGAEFSSEANPADVTEELCQVLARCGVTRLSLGAQSHDAGKLRLLERDHDRAGIERAVALARGAVETVAMDLIFGTPGETLSLWESELAATLELKPDHVSTYGLTFERGTQFWSRLRRGELARVDEGMEAAMYETAIDRLVAAGFEHYEVSNFARPGRRCRHNEVYWRGRTYFAAGPGAARLVEGRREVNHRSTTTWLQRVLAGRSPVAETETLSPESAARERFVFGMRRLEGVARDEFAAETGREIDALFGPPLRNWIERGLIEDTGAHLRLTRQGLLISDSLWPELL